MQHDIFISHHKDSSLGFVEQLAKWFEQGDNIYCWYTPRNLDSNGAGKDYDDEIVEAIQRSKCIVVVLNDMALQSKWVKREVTQAEKQGKMIFPVVISELTVNNGLLMRLEEKHLISVYPDPQCKYPLLLKNVKQLLGQDTSSIVIKNSAVDEPQQKIQSSFKFDIDFDEGLALLEVNESRDAFYAFLRSAENGNKQAEEHLYQLMYENSKDVNFVHEDTWDHIEELSDSGFVFADMLMHYRYYAMGTQHDIAMKYLKRCISKEIFGHAFLQLGICYGWGLGVQLNNALALHYYKKALGMGCVDACRYIGQLYTFGGDKVKRDYEKAEEYIRKGIELGSRKCYEKLFWLLIDKKDFVAAKKLAEQMISQNDKDGYLLMGEYFRCFENDGFEACKWYQKAVRYGNKTAWASLALLKRYNDNENSEAYKLAEKGCLENDSFSHYVLGWFYEEDENYEKAWGYYYKQVVKFGVGAQNLGRLYLEKKYLPNNFSLENLKIELRRSQDVDSVKCLLRIILMDNEKQEVLSFEQLKDVPEAYDYLRLGANLGDEELSFIYGKILIESEGKIFNSYSGIDFIESAAMKAHVEAIRYVLKFYEKNQDKEKKESLSSIVIENKLQIVGCEEIIAMHYTGSDWLAYLEWLFCIIEKDNPKGLLRILDDRINIYLSKDSQNISQWITTKVQDENLSNVELRFCLLVKYLKVNYPVVQNEILDKIRNLIQEFSKSELLLHALLPKIEEYMLSLFPDYNSTAILQGDFSSERDLMFCFALSNFFDDYILIDQKQIPLEKSFYSYLLQLATSEDIYAIGEDSEIPNNNFYIVYTRFVEECKMICSQSKIQFIDNVKLQLSEVTPYCSDEILCKYCKIAFRCFIECQNAFGEYWPELLTNIRNHEKLDNLLDIAEKIKDERLQMILISYVELSIEACGIYLNNRTIRNIIINKDKKCVADHINKYIKLLNSKKIAILSDIDTESLPEDIFEYNDNLKDSNDDFEYLLDKFINENLS